MSSIYVSNGWDEAGYNPSQAQLDGAIKHLRTFPSISRHNTLIWQPHLVHGQSFINDWWDWVNDTTPNPFDYESMKLAKNLMIFCFAPAPAFQEEADANKSKKSILTRSHLADMIKNGHPAFSSRNPDMERWYRLALADMYMSMHCVIDYMFREHDMYVNIVGCIGLSGQSFHYHFGHLFNNAPILPMIALSFHSQPKYTKHNPIDRLQLKNTSGSFTYWNPYVLPSMQHSVVWKDPNAANNMQMRVPWLRHWDHTNRVPGAFLTEAELEASPITRGLLNGINYRGYNNFDITSDWAADTFNLVSPYGTEVIPGLDNW